MAILEDKSFQEVSNLIAVTKGRFTRKIGGSDVYVEIEFLDDDALAPTCGVRVNSTVNPISCYFPVGMSFPIPRE